MDLLETVFKASAKVNDGRDLKDVLGVVMEEVGELSTEINIKTGHKDRKPGEDGIVGECVDAIAALVDVIYLEEPNLSQQEFNRLLARKCRKWVKAKNKS